MNRSIVAAFAFASAAIVAAPAVAAPFQGPYVGIQAGLNRDKIGSTPTDLGGITGDHGKSSLTGGVFAGYNYTIAPRVVIGGELGLEASSSDSISGSAGGEAAVLDPKRQIDVTARVGYLMDPQTLVYVRGGYTNVRVSTTVSQQAGAISRTNDLDGWTLGAGVERSLTSTVSARVEYRYTDLSVGRGKYDRNQVLVGLSYHF